MHAVQVDVESPGRVGFVGAPEPTDTLRRSLEQRGYRVLHRTGADEALELAQGGDIEVLVVGPDVADSRTLALVSEVSSTCPEVRVIGLAEHRDYGDLLAALRAGIFDCLDRAASTDDVEVVLARALAQRNQRQEVQRLRLDPSGDAGFEDLIGSSPAMQTLYDLISRAASTQASVLITGESGVGKELVARAIHHRSKRSDRPFVAINCSAIPEALLETELFGHTRGAFTDARTSRSGLFTTASGGTIFLDEIGDLSLSLQPKLLRALQERRIRPVGGEREIDIDIRLITATNVNLDSLVADKQFREDLYYRINVIPIEVPPLRERASDIPLLAQHFIETYARAADKPVAGIAPAAARKLVAYAWPGNVRELQNCMERAVALTRGEEVILEDLPEKVRNYKRSHVLVVSNEPSELVPMDEVERRYIVRVLQAVSGNKKEAASILGFDRKTLYRKIERYGIDSKLGRP